MSVIYTPSQLHAPRPFTVPQGLSVGEIMRALGAPEDATATVNGEPAGMDLIPGEGDHVLITGPLHGGGGKDPVRTLMTIAVVVASAYVPGAMGITSQLGTAVAQGAILTAGMYLVDALAPIRLPSSSTEDTADSPTYSVGGGRNEMRPFSPIPMVLGRHKMFPPLAARPFTELLGADEWLHVLVCWGWGPVEFDQDDQGRDLILIGETPIWSYAGPDPQKPWVHIETTRGYAGETLPKMPTVSQESIGATLKNSDGPIIRTAPAGSDELSIDVILPRGLIEFKEDGSRAQRELHIRIRYREVGTDTWSTLGEEKSYSSGSMSFPTGGYHRSQSGWWSLYAEEDGTVQGYKGRSPRENAVRIAEWRYVQGSGALHTPENIVENFTYLGGVESGLVVTSGGTRGTTISWTSGTAIPSQPFKLLDKTTSVIRKGERWRVDRAKQYEVELYRETPDSDDSKVLDEATWYVLRGIRHDPPITFPHPLAISYIRIKATDQLQGVVDNINAVVTSVREVWTGEGWGDPQPTTNPAALFRGGVGL